ncbi:outer membrane protein assembly factor BamB family protein [Streptomyces sp. SID1121]|uniref:outer membrane protein assembly factor BamB family protein n=1 Tax=Streptomyces sp. SID1121 TaxID=3425888 RepID=UPI004056CFC0
MAPAGFVARSASTGEVVWSVGADAAKGRNAGAAVDGNRAVAAGGRTLRAVDPVAGRVAWTKALPAGRTFGPPATAAGVVYAATYGAIAAEPQTLFAYRASDGTPLWHRDTTGIAPFALGGRILTVESGARAVARDGRTGEVVATSDPSHPCPSLIGAPGRLVCTESGSAAGDIFPPVVRVDPATLRFVRTLWQPGDKPHGGVISPDGVLVLRTVNAEDPSSGGWTGLDLTTGRTLWRTTGPEDGGTNDDVVLAGSRAVWISGGRLVSVDPRKGPYATGADAPRRSRVYTEASDRGSPRLTAYGTHLVLQPATRPALRSVTAP